MGNLKSLLRGERGDCAVDRCLFVADFVVVVFADCRKVVVVRFSKHGKEKHQPTNKKTSKDRKYKNK